MRYEVVVPERNVSVPGGDIDFIQALEASSRSYHRDMAEEKISTAVRETVRAANVLGLNDLGFHRSLDSTFSNTLDSCLSRMLGLTSTLLQYASDVDVPRLRQSEDVDSRWGDIIDIVDSLLERTDRSLEELTAQAKKEKEAAALKHMKQQEMEPLPASLRNAQDLPHPQLKFRRKPDNTEAKWTPLLTEKPNAQLSLEESLNRSRDVDGVQHIGHPYAYEIESIRYPDFIFEHKEPIMYQDVKATTATWVDSEAKLQSMLQELRKSREIAIDLEHHDFHSFRGFVCLMQISNRDQDWIVDTLALRDELVVLNEVFTDPSILKVLHGANSDVIWLQRDFGLYLVNLFDTYHASKTLGLDGHGLAYLLSKYVDFTADKRYQLADWRIRPLPKEMLYYARSDTHYLLYVSDIMRNELLEKSNAGTHNVISAVLQASADVSLRQYVKEPYDAAEGQGSDGWQFLLNRFYGTRAFGVEQLEVLKALHQWRDQKARELDESTRFVLPNQALVSMAAAMPKDAHSLLSVQKQVSSTVQSNLKPILKVIELARKYAINLPSAQPVTDAEATTKPADVNRAEVAARPSSPRSAGPIKLSLAKRSSFWGDLSRTLGITTGSSPLMDLRLSVPMPELAPEVYMTESELVRGVATQPGPTIAAPPVTDEVFVVRDVGKAAQAAKKRKSEVIDLDAEPVVNSPDMVAQKREARKRAKQAKLEAKSAAAAAVPAAEEGPAFDYAAQPSLLKEKEMKRSKVKKFGEFQGKIVRSKQVQGGKQTTFKR